MFRVRIISNLRLRVGLGLRRVRVGPAPGSWSTGAWYQISFRFKLRQGLVSHQGGASVHNGINRGRRPRDTSLVGHRLLCRRLTKSLSISLSMYVAMFFLSFSVSPSLPSSPPLSLSRSRSPSRSLPLPPSLPALPPSSPRSPLPPPPVPPPFLPPSLSFSYPAHENHSDQL